MSPRHLVAILAALTLPLVPGGIAHPFHAVASNQTRAPAQRLLYQTNWQHGTFGWRSTTGARGLWTTRRGILSCRCEVSFSDGEILAPVQTRGLANYAVQATIQVAKEDASCVSFAAGIVARSSKNPDTGVGLHAGWAKYDAGNANCHGGGQYAEVWYGSLSGDPGYSASVVDSANFAPGKRWHTYRLEVRGNDLRLVIDGQLALETSSSQFQSKHYVGLFARDSDIRVKVFEVYTL